MNIAQLLETDPATLKLGDVVDAYKALNDMRLLMQKEVEAVERIEKAYRQHLVDSLSKKDETGVFGRNYKAVIKTKRAFQVDTQNEAGGWSLVWGYIRQTGRWDLLQKRLNDKALKDMYEAGEALPPGVNTLTVPEVSITKL